MKKRAMPFIVLFLLIQGACKNSNTNSTEKSPEQTKVENQGVMIDYTDSEVGDTTLLFVMDGISTKITGSVRQSFFQTSIG